MAKRLPEQSDDAKARGRYIRPEVVAVALTGAITWPEAVLMALLESMSKLNDEGCFATNGYLAKQMNLSERRIRAMLENLELQGLIEKQMGRYRRLVPVPEFDKRGGRE